jgi:hypothetical protein
MPYLSLPIANFISFGFCLFCAGGCFGFSVMTRGSRLFTIILTIVCFVMAGLNLIFLRVQ